MTKRRRNKPNRKESNARRREAMRLACKRDREENSYSKRQRRKFEKQGMKIRGRIIVRKPSNAPKNTHKVAEEYFHPEDKKEEE